LFTPTPSGKLSKTASLRAFPAARVDFLEVFSTFRLAFLNDTSFERGKAGKKYAREAGPAHTPVELKPARLARMGVEKGKSGATLQVLPASCSLRAPNAVACWRVGRCAYWGRPKSGFPFGVAVVTGRGTAERFPQVDILAQSSKSVFKQSDGALVLKGIGWCMRLAAGLTHECAFPLGTTSNMGHRRVPAEG
jgi:hypothetical protein